MPRDHGKDGSIPRSKLIARYASLQSSSLRQSCQVLTRNVDQLKESARQPRRVGDLINLIFHP